MEYFFSLVIFSVQLELVDSGAQKHHKRVMKVHYIQSLLNLYNSFVNFKLAGNGLLSQVEPEDLINPIL